MFCMEPEGSGGRVFATAIKLWSKACGQAPMLTWQEGIEPLLLQSQATSNSYIVDGSSKTATQVWWELRMCMACVRGECHQYS